MPHPKCENGVRVDFPLRPKSTLTPFPPPADGGGLGWGRQQPLDLGGDSAVARGDLRWPGAGELSVGPDQVFVKVPTGRAGFANLRGYPSIERVSLGADNPG